MSVKGQVAESSSGRCSNEPILIPELQCEVGVIILPLDLDKYDDSQTDT